VSWRMARLAHRAVFPSILLVTIGLVGILTGAGLAALASPMGRAGPFVVVAAVLFPLFVLAVARRPRLGVAAVLAVFPVGSLAVPGVPAQLQLVEAAVIAIALIVALQRLALGKGLFAWSPLLWWPVSLIAWMLIAFPLALDEHLAIRQIALFGGGLLLASVVMTACQTMKDVRFVIGTFMVIMAGIAMVGLVSMGTLEPQLGGTRVGGRLTGAFDDPNQLGAVSAMALMVTVGLALGSPIKKFRAVSWAIIPLLLGSLALSLSRGAWIGTALGGAYILIGLRKARRPLVVGTFVLLVLFASFSKLPATSLQVEVVGLRLQALTSLSPYDARTAIWGEALKEIREDPWTGKGPGNFPVASIRAASAAREVFAHHAHNLVLTWAAESGIPAVLLLIGFGVSLGVTVRRTRSVKRSERDQAVITGLTAALITTLGQGMVDFTWRNAVVFLSLAALTGALIAAASASSGEEPQGPEMVFGRQKHSVERLRRAPA